MQVRAISGDLPFNSLEIVQDGKVVAEWHGPKPVLRRELKVRLKIGASSWIAARCSGPNTVHAHTNPVWIYFNGQAPFKPEAAAELLKRIQGFEASKIGPEAKKVAEAARIKVEQLSREGGELPRPATTYAQRFPVSPSDAMRFPPALARPKSLGPATVEGIVVTSSGRPLPGAAVSVRGVDPAARTDSSGRFVLRGVDANQPLFLRVSKPGHATTNTAYLNPRGPKENVRILLLTEAELSSVASDASERAVLLFNSIGAGGKPVAGLTLTASPAGTTHFASPAAKTLPVQIVGTTEISFQPAFPPQDNDHEPNVIVTANPLAKDLVMPAFAGQVTYAVIRE